MEPKKDFTIDQMTNVLKSADGIQENCYFPIRVEVWENTGENISKLIDLIKFSVKKTLTL